MVGLVESLTIYMMKDIKRTFIAPENITKTGAYNQSK